jgi:tRNA threonylcarbamoyl adenosine modification protein (Sua5/YciO/YrdC/YwlC family)
LEGFLFYTPPVIEYIIESNPDDRILFRACEILQKGGVVAFPTETNWVIAANPYLQKSVDKIYKLRHIENTKHLTMMVPDFKAAMSIASIDDHAFALMKKVVPGSFTFILEANKKITKYLKASKLDHQVGIRFPPRKLCQALLKAHGDVLLTSHINHSMLEEEDESIPLYSAQIEDYFGGKIDLILDPGEFEFIGSTTIVDFTSGEPEVIREGIGDSKIFKRN